MFNIKTLSTRVVSKHDLEANWLNKSPSFIPKKGEIVVYDAEQTTDLLPEGRVVNIPYPRQKIGDGVTSIIDLPFITTFGLNNEETADYNFVTGVSNHCGSKAFTITAMNELNKTYTLDSVEGLEIGDIYSLHIQYLVGYDSETGSYQNEDARQAENLGQIVAIDTETNTVTVDVVFNIPKYIPENEDDLRYNRFLPLRPSQPLVDERGVDHEVNTFRIPAKPSVGTRQIGDCATAEGTGNVSLSKNAHAEGYYTLAQGSNAHTEGYGTTAIYAAHAEGKYSSALGQMSHAEGDNTLASGLRAHAEGYRNVQKFIDVIGAEHSTGSHGHASHAEGMNTVAEANFSHAEGYHTVASYDAAHAEGSRTIASGNHAHAEGNRTIASGSDAHAEGSQTVASGSTSHAEGDTTVARGNGSHTEGTKTIAYGTSSHAEGIETRVSTRTQEDGTTEDPASTRGAHAEGYQTRAGNIFAHAEGYVTTASGASSHAEGSRTTSVGEHSHAEGHYSAANGNDTHAEGYKTVAGNAAGNKLEGHVSAAHAEGYQTVAFGDAAHAEGGRTVDTFDVIIDGNNVGKYTEIGAYGNYSHVEGRNTVALSTDSHAEGSYNVASGVGSHAEGNYTRAEGQYAHSQGKFTLAAGQFSHAEGYVTTASLDAAHAEGSRTVASGAHSHAEGHSTIASGEDTHAEGRQTEASGQFAHAEGFNSLASGKASHVEGEETTAGGAHSHAEGFKTRATGHQSHAEGEYSSASGYASHAEGASTQAVGDYSHSAGYHTLADEPYEFVVGSCNQTELQALFIVGNGTSTRDRSNAFWVLNDGSAFVQTTYDTADKSVVNVEYVKNLVAPVTQAAKDNTTAIQILNSNSAVEGSVDKKIADAFNEFATAVSDDKIVNTYKELVDYAASHGSDIEELVGEVEKNTRALEVLVADETTIGSIDYRIAEATANLDQYATKQSVEESFKTVYTKAEVDKLVREAVQAAQSEFETQQASLIERLAALEAIVNNSPLANATNGIVVFDGGNVAEN